MGPKILVLGAGIAGPALAFFLSSSKVFRSITVIERSPTLRTAGLQLDLRGPGIDVLKRMGLEPKFRSHAAPELGLQVVDKHGKRRAFFPANKSGSGSQSFTSEYEIMRADFSRILVESGKERGVIYRFGVEMKGFEEKDDQVDVRFSDGTTEKFDLVVGADGVWSATRKMMLGSSASAVVHPLSGMYVAYFTIPRPIQKEDEYLATLYMAPGKRGLMTRRQSPDKLMVYAGGKSDSEAFKNISHGDVEKEKEFLATFLKGAGWQTDEVVDGMMKTEEFYCERLALIKMNSWSRGRVTLVGDAAYCPTVNTGMGTTCAIVGAYVLAGEIVTHLGNGKRGTEAGHDLSGALETYEKKLKPFITEIQKGVDDRPDNGMLPSSAFAITIMHWVLGIASYLNIDVGKWMVKGEVKGWNLPEYPELEGL
ncbi:FAD/NAD(P)-binding domain-containing protein [Polyplosphaeria fusca]|uniref:FAD/NAD(P)-binding domain-containing protein n=1 Tax=Polyplosphaeria fusca TaxID=682080 RepID=A0A9P4V5X1_9PLEO|nr:FAD/NAD(P)-binding domain-containing protein [Polyplosphaeria fusca]